MPEPKRGTGSGFLDTLAETSFLPNQEGTTQMRWLLAVGVIENGNFVD